MGTPEFGATVLKTLVDNGFEVTGVVTQPDRSSGRHKKLAAPPVKKIAQELNLPVMQLERLKGEKVIEDLRKFAGGAEVFVVAAFGMLLPGPVLEIPPLKCINVHGSLLPRYRGASPVAQAILDGCQETGVTIMLMEKGLDTGQMLSKTVVPVDSAETQLSLMAKLAKTGSELLVSTLPRWASGQIIPQPQDSSQASLTGIIKKEDGKINWSEPAEIIERKVRAYFPWPGTFTTWKGQTLKIIKARTINSELPVSPGSLPIPPGEVVEGLVAGKPVPLISTGQGLLQPLEMQLPGKKPVQSPVFISGYPLFIGSMLE